MKNKLTSRKFWVALLTNIISLTVIFKEVGGNVGVVAGIIGVIASSVSYMISEGMVDVTRLKTTSDEVLKLSKDLDKKEGE